MMHKDRLHNMVCANCRKRTVNEEKLCEMDTWISLALSIPLSAPLEIRKGNLVENLKFFRQAWEMYCTIYSLDKEPESKKWQICYQQLVHSVSDCTKIDQ